MLQPYEAPHPPANQEDDPAHQCGNGAVSVVRRNRSVSIREHLQLLSVQEEVVLLNDSIQRHVMDLQLQEAKRRAEEQSLMLDMRTEQLLNYTQEHASQIQDAVNGSETRVRADLQTQFNEFESNLEETKTWIQAYLRIAMESHDREIDAKASGATKTYIDECLKQRDAEMAKMIYAQVRAERQKDQVKWEERVNAYVDDAARAVQTRVDAKLVELKQDHQRCKTFQSNVAKQLHKIQIQTSLAPQQSAASILQKVETTVDARIKAEANKLMTSQEQSIESTVTRILQNQKSPTKATAERHYGETQRISDKHSPSRRSVQAKALRGGIQDRKLRSR